LPTVIPCCAASCFAAFSTSASRSRVVRTSQK
jgi:hypothetical protein